MVPNTDEEEEGEKRMICENVNENDIFQHRNSKIDAMERLKNDFHTCKCFIFPDLNVYFIELLIEIMAFGFKCAISFISMAFHRNCVL